MPIRPMLDDLELPLVQEVLTLDRRALAEHKPPGMAGSLLQNLGRQPTSILISGVAAGPEARQFVEDLQEKFTAGEAMPFSLDISADSGIDEVIVNQVSWEEVAGKPDRYAYLLQLHEYIEPVEPPSLAAINQDILNDALARIDELVDGLNLADFFTTGLEPYPASLGGFLTRLQQAESDIEGASSE